MATTPVKFNQGGTTSDAIERQFTPEYVLKAVVEMPKAKRPFSKMASVFAMPKNHGDTVTQEVRHGMMEKDNVLSGAMDAEHATLAIGKIYSNNGSLFDVEEYLIDNGQDWDAALAAAKADAIDDGGIKEYAPSGLIDGKSTYAAYQGTFLPLPEEGGILNGFKSKSSLISASLSWHMVHMKYTARSNDLDSRVGMVARHIQDLGDVVAEAKEGQLQASIQKVANENRTISTESASTTNETEIDGMDVLRYEALEQLGIELQNARVPMDTTMIKGVDLQDTVTVSGGYIMYVNREVLPTLSRLEGPGGVLVWRDVKRYAAGSKETIEGEIGSLDGLPFRFVVVENLQVERGVGAPVNDDNDAADAATGASAYSTVDKVNGGSRYDVFSGLVVGDDSFSVTGFGYNSTKAVHVSPKRDVYNDLTGSVGAVVADWSYAFLPYRPERIAKISFSLQKSGKAPVAG